MAAQVQVHPSARCQRSTTSRECGIQTKVNRVCLSCSVAADSPSERGRLLLEQFKAAVAAEARAREAMHDDPGNAALLQAWLRAMDATHEASRALREGTLS
jgi:hypothetical protein